MKLFWPMLDVARGHPHPRVKPKEDMMFFTLTDEEFNFELRAGWKSFSSQLSFRKSKQRHINLAI